MASRMAIMGRASNSTQLMIVCDSMKLKHKDTKTQSIGNLLVCFSFIFGLALAGCRADSREVRKRNDEVILNCGGNPRSIDPIQVTDTISARAMGPFM